MNALRCAVCGFIWLRHHPSESYCPIVNDDDKLVQWSDEKFMRASDVPPGRVSVNGSLTPFSHQQNITKDA